MRISEATIRKITENADIVAIIGEHIKLEKKGNDYKGICPFHNDTNPSLSVSPSKKVFKCFSCGVSGNAVGFIQRYKNLSFPQAIKYVGEKMGIPVDIDDNVNQDLQKYLRIMEDAANYYEFYLKNSIEGKEAIQYLNDRHLDEEIVRRFKIGLASDEFDLLYKALTERENPYLPLNLLEVGLIKAGKENTYYDVFRSRIMFPIDDFNGNIIGFSGRIYKKTKKNEPKYINSNENVIFKKSNILYNYSRAVNVIKQKNHVFIFEGFMDVIAAYRAKIENAIATMGTALTNQQIQAIKKATNNITLCFDGDNPGIEASKRAIEMFHRANFNIKVMLLPEGLDPDEYANRFGTTSLYDFLENKTLSAPDYFYELEKRKLNKNDLYSVETFKQNVFAFLKMFNIASLTEIYLKKVADELNITITSISDDFQKKRQPQFVPPIHTPKERKAKSAATKRRYIANEKCAVYHAYNSKNACLLILNEKTNFTYADADNRNILFKIFDYYKTNDKMNDDFMDCLNESERMILAKILQEINEHNIITLDECLQINLEFRNEKIQEKLKEAFKNNGIDDKGIIDFIESKKITTKIVKSEE